jgi:hypothetical protein
MSKLQKSNLYLRLSTFSNSDLDMQQEDILQQAHQDFLRQGKLDDALRGNCSFDEYLDFLAEHDVDMDDYLEIIDCNLQDFI